MPTSFKTMVFFSTLAFSAMLLLASSRQDLTESLVAALEARSKKMEWKTSLVESNANLDLFPRRTPASSSALNNDSASPPSVKTALTYVFVKGERTNMVYLSVLDSKEMAKEFFGHSPRYISSGNRPVPLQGLGDDAMIFPSPSKSAAELSGGIFILRDRVVARFNSGDRSASEEIAHLLVAAVDDAAKALR